jgi:prolyl-tRNA synthetase
MLRVYETFARGLLALPVFTGEKSEGERFLCGADALHRSNGAGSESHSGRHFTLPGAELRAREWDPFVSRSNAQEFAWTTSWGVSTRLIGTVIMAHGDDDG